MHLVSIVLSEIHLQLDDRGFAYTKSQERIRVNDLVSGDETNTVHRASPPYLR
jgi:hypothetical protein